MAIKQTNSILQETPIMSTREPTRPPLVKSATVASDALSTTSTVVVPVVPSFDIEHMPVENDPRTWSSLRKNAILFLIAFAAMVAALAANIQNPAVEQMEADLPATPAQFSLSISMFILVQGLMPVIWSSISEVKGRKLVYIISLALFTLGSIIVALSQHIGPIIGFRCLQAAGSSAVMAIGAASLADIFEPEERGRKMGIYYVAPLLGPALGPIFGGILTTVWGWRSIFWFLAILCGTCLITFVFFFRDTFRSERSLTYQNVLKQRLYAAAMNPNVPKVTSASTVGKGCLQANKSDINIDIEKTIIKTEENAQGVIEVPKISLTLRDVNPFKPMYLVLRRPNNVLILLTSGLLYAFGFQLAYATSRRLGESYGYNPLKIGLVTISYGAGSVMGSVLGGRWSDRLLKRIREANNGKSYPEMRLKSTLPGLIMLPILVLGFGWLCDKVQNVAAISFFLFIGGFVYIWIYSSTLAYVVDANVGRSSTAVAANSGFRGIFAFIATEIAVPLQDGVGDGWMYTIWTGILLLNSVIVLLVWMKGTQWRENAEAREKRHAARFESATFSSTRSITPPNW
ncbi:hypothetical protein CVT25_012846 [Psilocybe cyanescens]|uniref:Major facilitator superfamily (MFS) profile domain-containing protein n=1 Tax=Psilocybe cyanescens TaxID=93625 RepID=A0A409VR56_PSICY|nr:hypothetical protein CVT25_012846 [Psilocybe cyanescens]